MTNKIGKFMLVVIAAIVLLVGCSVGSVIGTKNKLNRLYHEVQNCKSKVENLIHDKAVKIPDLTAVVERGSRHEVEITEAIAGARANANTILEAGDVSKMDEANQNLEVQIDQIRSIIVESYPEIATSQQYIGLMDEISSAQAMISIAREDYINACTEYNIKISEFPTSLFADMWGYEEIEMYQKAETDSESGLVNFGS